MPRINYRRCLKITRRYCLIILLTVALVYIEARRKHVWSRAVTLEPSAAPACHKHTNKSEKTILNIISDLNSKQLVLNMEQGELSAEHEIVIVVLSETFSDDFNMFLTSLSEVTGIEDALVVFSHSRYDETLNDAIRSIRFCRVLQIFYPYSIQTHSKEFPGAHADDCSSDMAQKTAQEINCTGAYFPDVRGHYRNPSKTEIKHHWWWTANQVFERLNCNCRHAELVIFLENHLIFTNDFIYVATYMQNLAKSVPRCEFVSLGSNRVRNKYNVSDIYAARLTDWDPKIHSSVLAFNITTWNIIASHYDLFCGADDVSWARSLNYISSNRRDGRKFKVVTGEVPRAFNINFCIGRTDCDASYLGSIIGFLNATENLWFPPYMELYVEVWRDFISEPETEFDLEGGWADPRDRALCYNMTYNKMKSVILQMHLY